LAPRFDDSKAVWKVTENTSAARDGGIEAARLAAEGKTADSSEDGKGKGKGKQVKHDRVFSFEIDPKQIEIVRKKAYEMQLPLLKEYDFRKPTISNPDLPLSLRTTTQIRPYQEKSLSKIFSNGRARSGIIVLPCGAGKTCVGITAATTCHKRTLVLTTTSVAVDQWRRQFQLFTTIDPSDVLILTADKKQEVPDDRAVVLVSTYSMFGSRGRQRNETSRTEQIFKSIEAVEWGMLIVDEVQVMPAKSFRTVITTVKAHCIIGLTATLVREDGLVQDLQWLIGPKLFEANWQELVDLGHLANVQCAEVWCPMTKEFFSEYQNTKKAALQRGLANCNPIKLNTAEYLIKFHEERGDKIIVFSDNVWILEILAKRLKKFFISGKVDLRERMHILHSFQTSPNHNVVFLSKVGDNAIDLPCANVIIQISAHFGARRQEAQRLGRILRPKPGAERLRADANGGFNAFFYTLVSRDTQEMFYANKRQQFLVDQGYAYRVVTTIKEKNMVGETFSYSDKDVQKDLLHKVQERCYQTKFQIS
jgi:DNA excision repair protein ERCC-3